MNTSVAHERSGAGPARERMGRHDEYQTRALGDISIWCVMLDEQPPEALPHLRTLLSPDEVERARRFRFERDRRRFQVGRGVLRTLIGHYLNRPPQEIVFAYGANGKPSLAAVDGVERVSSALRFNVAHSDGLALIAFNRAGEIGVDVEFIRDVPEWERLADAWFSRGDVARLAGTRPELRRAEFFRLWTRTEAALKATGEGLGALPCPMPDVEVFPLHLEPGFAAALASPDPGEYATLHLWQHNPRLPFGGQQRSQRIRLEDSSSNKANFL